MKPLPDKADFVARIRQGDRIALARAITYVESTLPAHRKFIGEVLDELMPYTGGYLRIGVTGSPGVGKSTFIEALGAMLVRKGYKVGVLTIDPSSRHTGGSILGDKTRMYKLAAMRNAFIRPSPARRTLGGVTTGTREAILLCEAAGYEIILVETVGIGQSETAVYDMTDFFLLMILAGAGDELQGIKRGIVELADMIVVNKADGDGEPLAKKTQSAYANAIHLFPPKELDWTVPVLTASALKKYKIHTIWKRITDYKKIADESGYFEKKREEQLLSWMDEAFRQMINSRIAEDDALEKASEKLRKEVRKRKKTPISAANELISLFLRGKK